MRARELMTPRVITVSADTAIVEAANIMLRHHIGALPVVEAAGRLIGIISEGDFIRRAETGTEHRRGRWLTFLAGADRVAADFSHEHGRKVGEVMTPAPLFTVAEDTPLDQVAQIMESHNVKRVPVMRGDRMVGILTRSDFLAAARLARNAPGPSEDDDDIRRQVMAALAQAPWRPCRLNVTVRDGVASLGGVIKNESARRAAIIAAKNVAGVKNVRDHLSQAPAYPPPEEDFGGGDFVSLQAQPSTTDDEPL